MVLDDVFQAAGMTSHVYMGDLATALASWLRACRLLQLPCGGTLHSRCTCRRLCIGSARFVDFDWAVARLELDGSNTVAAGDTWTCMVCSRRRPETPFGWRLERSSADLREARLAVCCALLDATMVKPGMLPSWGAVLTNQISCHRVSGTARICHCGCPVCSPVIRERIDREKGDQSLPAEALSW